MKPILDRPAPDVFFRVVECYLRADVPASLAAIWTAEHARDLPGGAEHAARVCAFFELVAMLHGHGLLPTALLFEWLSVGPIWDRVKPYALALRRESGDTLLWHGFETLAAEHKRLTGVYST